MKKENNVTELSCYILVEDKGHTTHLIANSHFIVIYLYICKVCYDTLHIEESNAIFLNVNIIELSSSDKKTFTQNQIAKTYQRCLRHTLGFCWHTCYYDKACNWNSKEWSTVVIPHKYLK